MHHSKSTLKIASSYVNKYPKFLLLFITFLIAYLLFSGRTDTKFHVFIVSLGYFGTFLVGMLFSYGFTAAPATAILLVLGKEQNIIAAGLIAGLGALLADWAIFKLIRHSFKDEIEKLSNERTIRIMHEHIPSFAKKYLLPVFAGFIIASPLPDEIGVTLLAIHRQISAGAFSLISYTLNTAGIFVILKIGSGL